MRIPTMPLIATAGLILTACAAPQIPTSPQVKPVQLAPGVLSGPAAKYCASKGGTIRPEIGRAGRPAAICYLPDHRIVEINALYDVEVINRL